MCTYTHPRACPGGPVRCGAMQQLRILAGVVALTAGLASGCAGAEQQTADRPEPATQTGTLPDCEDLWVDGEQLPEPYEGCTAGEVVEAATYYTCTDGRRLTASDRGWAFSDDRVIHTTEDPDNDKAYARALYEDCKP